MAQYRQSGSYDRCNSYKIMQIVYVNGTDGKFSLRAVNGSNFIESIKVA